MVVDTDVGLVLSYKKSATITCIWEKNSIIRRKTGTKRRKEQRPGAPGLTNS